MNELFPSMFSSISQKRLIPRRNELHCWKFTILPVSYPNTCQQGDVAATLIIFLYYWDGRFCMKTFSLSVTKDPTLILEHFVLYWLHSAFDEIMNYEIICWTESHSDSYNSKQMEIILEWRQNISSYTQITMSIYYYFLF